MKRLSALLLAALLSVGSAVAPAFADTSSVSTFSSASTSNQACTRYLPANGTLIAVNGLTAAAAALTVKASGAGETPSTVPSILGPNGLQQPIITADGLYRVNSAGYLRVCAQISTTGTGNVTVTFVHPTNGGYESSNSLTPCNKTVGVNISSATTTSIVTGVAAKHVVLCAYFLTVTGTSPTVKFIGGVTTSTPCDTSPGNLTGTFAPITGASLNGEMAGYPLFDNTSVAGSNPDLCIVSGGTTPSVQGLVKYGIL